ncbi:MAG: hypothetical protein H7Z37_05930 [Pyrinomonadaceae bacterium]|nr:hypothetical protein [Pyrinomonadaceae bacterium]
MNVVLFDAIGWTGAIMLLAAYALVSFNRIKADSFNYQFLNIFGSLFLAINTFYRSAFASTFLNVVWAIIAVIAIIAARRKWAK